jgi:hypothetical protein
VGLVVLFVFGVALVVTWAMLRLASDDDRRWGRK